MLVSGGFNGLRKMFASAFYVTINVRVRSIGLVLCSDASESFVVCHSHAIVKLLSYEYVCVRLW
jgi:hypothetical protein